MQESLEKSVKAIKFRVNLHRTFKQNAHKTIHSLSSPWLNLRPAEWLVY
jgi:hypothetical protein